ncbi:hypothetical protein F4821DRAFT_265460 [Hypoxylon rubiginosum]|uniref:Uncharacterized protein n=1 Tax=Hypoxylon rubiginosum TaxID=110542 RepID=A0ACC0CKI7_9PEZI|nr:hypothetical protein F4821DRAFT_265460 [Hypoxylon rubiginosum]
MASGARDLLKQIPLAAGAKVWPRKLPVETALIAISPRIPSSDQMFQDYTHILEAFTFARVVYDEFSYSDPAAALFVKHTKAHAKWVLSATPPTRHLKAVCGIANLVNVHIARPVHSRAGMPRITEGPKFEQTSNAESLVARKFMGIKMARTRRTPRASLVRRSHRHCYKRVMNLYILAGYRLELGS